MHSDGTIAIAATFTAEPVADSIKYWAKQLDVSVDLKFAPYNQVIQTLLDAKGLFGSNRNGLNVVLIRFEDWERFRIEPGKELSSCRNAEWRLRNRELIDAVRTAASPEAASLLVCICPPPPLISADPEQKALCDQLENELRAGLAGIPSIRLLSRDRLLERYSVVDHYNATADRLGHIPYTAEAYAAFRTAIIRVFHAPRRTPSKVIVVDCDNTLWRGICGERGPRGVEIDAPGRALQTFLKTRRDQGMLLCVCSKNNAEDVQDTFREHPGMPLSETDFIGWRVNWLPKSENIQSLAAELSLGLDTFIFIDDNPMETAEVRARCPGVHVLTLPANIHRIPQLLEHVWLFDRYGVTAEDRRRTAMYHENAHRKKVLAESLSYADFLAGLELRIEIRDLNGDDEIARAAQMTQRVNQFNCTTLRVTEPQLREMRGNGLTLILTTFVTDKYGEYGQVGLTMCEAVGDVLHVQNVLLSCRVLGKGVEHAIIARLGQIAIERSLAALEISYVPTPKNTPARQFLTSLGAQCRNCEDQRILYRLPADIAARTRFSIPTHEAIVPPDIESSGDVAPSSTSRTTVNFEWIATHRCTAALIQEAITDSREMRSGAADAGQPRNQREGWIVGIWQRALGISPIGIDDNFFDLGGDSLLAVRIIAELQTITDHELSLTTLIQAPTISELAQFIEGVSERRDTCLVPIKSSGSRPPFYCVHGVGGNVLELVDLARHIRPDQPFYGIQAIGLIGTAPVRKYTVEEMARHYILEMRKFQPVGPYYIGGSSFGGLVAYEMARQLIADAQPVGLIAMFDTSVPGAQNTLGQKHAWRERIEILRYRFALHWSNLLTLSSGDRRAYIRKKTRRIRRLIAHRLTSVRRYITEGIPKPDADLIGTIQAVNDAGHWAEGNYVAGEYSGSITLFRATEQPPWIVSDRTLGWGALVKGGVQVYDTPGHHADLVRDPRARQLAEQLEDALIKAQAGGSGPLFPVTSSPGNARRDARVVWRVQR